MYLATESNSQCVGTDCPSADGNSVYHAGSNWGTPAELSVPPITERHIWLLVAPAEMCALDAAVDYRVGANHANDQLTTIVDELHELLAALKSGNLRQFEKTWTHHVNCQNCDVDYDKLIEQRWEQLRAASRAKGNA